MVHESYFWYSLLKICENLRGREPDAAETLQAALAELETLNESYNKCFDPVDEFEKYAVIEFSKTLEKLLSAQLLPSARGKKAGGEQG